MAEQIPPRTNGGIQAALENLTDGLSRLVRQHLELAKIEARHEAKVVGQNVAVLAIFSAIALLGYGLLNLAIILTALWLGSVAAMAITSIIVAVLNLGGAGFALSKAASRLRENDLLPKTAEEMKRNKKWIQEIRENSSSPRITSEET